MTETDEKVEAHVISALRTRFPGHTFIGEETTASGKKAQLTDDPTWIIDPIDGTMNFVHGKPTNSKLAKLCSIPGLKLAQIHILWC